jgi:Reverse transcriptase (RNA-dependent DNA polymerase)
VSTGDQRFDSNEEITPVPRSSILKRATVFRGRFIKQLKDIDTPTPRKKARMVEVSAYDPDKRFLITHAPTVRKSSARLVCAIAASVNANVWTRVVTQAFFQADKKPMCDVYIEPPGELRLPEDVIWRVDQVLYGLPESPGLWFATYHPHLTSRDQLGMTASLTDPCLFVEKTTNELFGTIALQMDDTFCAGSDSFASLEATKSRRFLGTPAVNLSEANDLSFNGTTITKENSCAMSMHQRSYCQVLPSAPLPRTASSFATGRGKAAYATTFTRPDVSCEVNVLSQIVACAADEADFVDLEDALNRLRSIHVALRFPSLDLPSVVVHVCGDALFAGNRDLSSQMGCVILLVDKYGYCAFIDWGSVKSKRVCRSVLGAELYACARAYDIGVAIKHSLDGIIGRSVDIALFTDSLTLLDC